METEVGDNKGERKEKTFFLLWNEEEEEISV
jgi:hypothetical protein